MVTKRTRKTASEKSAESNAADLISALEFISVAQREAGEPRQTFCQMDDNFIFGTDGALSAGCPIDGNISAFVHTFNFTTALKKCVGAITMVQEGDGKAIKVKAGKFSAAVPCYNEFDKGNFPKSSPDPKIAVLTNAVKDSLKACYPLTNESSPDIHTAGILLQANTAVSTNGIVLLEYWHGIDLPTIVIPKAAAAAIANCHKNLTGFGFSDRSATFYFEDDSYIKTQLFEPKYPNYLKMLEAGANETPAPVHPDFFKALDHVLPFSPNHQIYIKDGLMKSSELPRFASYELTGMDIFMGFNGVYLKQLEKHFKEAFFKPDDFIVFFYGENCRGAIRSLFIKIDHTDDDIPF